MFSMWLKCLIERGHNACNLHKFDLIYKKCNLDLMTISDVCQNAKMLENLWTKVLKSLQLCVNLFIKCNSDLMAISDMLNWSDVFHEGTFVMSSFLMSVFAREKPQTRFIMCTRSQENSTTMLINLKNLISFILKLFIYQCKWCSLVTHLAQRKYKAAV